MEKARVLEVAGDAPARGQAGGTMVSREAELPWRAEPSRTGLGPGRSLSSKSAFRKRQGGKPQFNKHLVGSRSPICIQNEQGQNKVHPRVPNYRPLTRRAKEPTSPRPDFLKGGKGGGGFKEEEERGRKKERKEPQINPL